VTFVGRTKGALNTLVLLVAVAAPAASQGPPEERGTLTQLRIVVDSTTWHDVAASDFLAESFQRVTRPTDGEISLCGRFACLVLVAPGDSSGTVPGSITLGAMPASGGTLVPPATDSLPPGVRVARIESPPPPDWTVDPDSLGVIYDLTEATVALDPSAVIQVARSLHRAGITVEVDGMTATVLFGAATVHLVPAGDVGGLVRATFLLRRPAAGNPTYRFGGRSLLRFGPGRAATWTF
jgi:hypothetical protein